MDLLSILLVVAIVWVSVVLVTMALCRAAGRADSVSERFRPTLR
jgi:hypothetical protein